MNSHNSVDLFEHEKEDKSDSDIESGILCGARSDSADFQQCRLDLADGTHLILKCETKSNLGDVGKQIWAGSLLLCDYIANKVGAHVWF